MYICEKCGISFQNENECNEHEKQCLNVIYSTDSNKYNDFLKKISDNNQYDGNFYSSVTCINCGNVFYIPKGTMSICTLKCPKCGVDQINSFCCAN